MPTPYIALRLSDVKRFLIFASFSGNTAHNGLGLAGSFWFDPQMNCTVAVHPHFMRTALGIIYPAARLAKELRVQ